MDKAIRRAMRHGWHFAYFLPVSGWALYKRGQYVIGIHIDTGKVANW